VKARRFLAYILMITIVLGNTMSVSATSSVVSGNEIADLQTEGTVDEAVEEEVYAEDEEITVSQNAIEDGDTTVSQNEVETEDATVSGNETVDEEIIEEGAPELPVPEFEVAESVEGTEHTPIYGAYRGVPATLAPSVPGSVHDEWNGDRINWLGVTGDIDSDFERVQWKILDPEAGLLWADGDLEGEHSNYDLSFAETEQNAIKEMRLLTEEELMNPEFGFSCTEGEIITGFETDDVGRVPALVLDTDKIFMTVYENYTSDNTVLADDYSDRENRKWNLIFESGDAGFAAEIPKSVSVEETLEVSVTSLASKEYTGISMTLTDSEGNLVVFDQLGGVNTESGNGNPEVDIYQFYLPEDLLPGRYTICVFEECEIWDEEYTECRSGYVSNYVEQEIVIIASTTPELSLSEEGMTVRVAHIAADDTEITEEYRSLEEALSSLAADFGSDKGTYTFTFIEDIKINASVTMPSFVQKAVFKAEAGGMFPDFDGYSVGATNGTIVFVSDDEEVIWNVDATLTAKEVIMQSGKWHLNTVSATTFTNSAYTYTDAIKNVTTLNNAAGAILVADTYTQKTTGKTNLEADSKLAILTSGTFCNTVLGGTDAEADGLVYVYALEGSKVAFETKVSSVNGVKMSFGRIMPEEPQRLLTDTIEVLQIEPRTQIFTSKISAFPVELIAVNQPEESDHIGVYEEVYQDGTGIYVGREWITISTKQVNGDEEPLKTFIRWSDAAAYLNTLANTPMEYVVEIAEDIEMTTALTLPTKVKGITFRGNTLQVLDENGAPIVNRVKITYTGDLKLASNTTFENIELIAKKYNSKTQKYDDYKSAVNGNGKELALINTSADFTSVTGVKCLNLDNTNLTVTQSVSVTDTLKMEASVLDAGTTVSLKNVITNGAGNLISYGGNTTKNILTISGTISSETGRNAVLLRAKALEKDDKYTQGTLLCNAQKAGANWFAIANAEGTGAADIGTYKKGNAIYCGEIEENVTLYSSVQRESDYVEESSFATLQEAFSEIDKLALSDKYYYIELKTDTKGVVTFADKNLTFPSKAKEVIISGGNIYMKDSMTLKCNTAFEGSVLIPTKAATLSVGKFELLAKDCLIGDGNSNTGFKKITGSGVTGTSKLTLDNTSLTVTGDVSGIGTLVYADTQEEEQAVYGMLRNRNVIGVSVYPTLISMGVISVGNIELQTQGYLTGTAKVTRNKSKVVTAVTSQITIGGEVISVGEPNKTLYIDLQESVSGKYIPLDFDNTDMAAMLNSGVKLAKATAVTYPDIRASQRSDKMLIKSGGYMTYFEGGYGIELSYEDENGQAITTACRTFADAVTEINNQKVKRDYTITLLQANTEISGADQNGSNEVPKALSMPNKSYVDTLTIQSDEDAEGPVELGFINNLTMTGKVILKNVTFVQMIKSGSKYVRADVLKDDYPAAVTLNTAGYDLVIKGVNTFNTPLILNGGTKGNISFDEDGTITTLTNDYDIVPDLSEDVIENVIFGYITGFNTVDADGCNLTVKEYRASRTSDKYTASANKMTTLNVTERGEGTGIVTVVGQKAKGSLTVTNLNSINGKILVDGKVNLKNVSIEGTQEPTIRADLDFNITGAFVNRSDNTLLITRLKGAGKVPYLNISGTLDRVGQTGPIMVCVYPESTASAAIRDIPVTPLIATGKTSAQLLTAKNAKARDFMPHEVNYAGGEYDFENTSGYMMFKSSSNIMVYDGSKVAVGVYEGQTMEEDSLVGFYPSVKDATSFVNGLKDKTKDYTYVLLAEGSTAASPVSVTIPSYANSITLKSLEDGMYISGIAGAGTQILALDIPNLTVTGTIEKVKELVVKEDATVNKAVKATELSLVAKEQAEEEYSPVTLKVLGAITVTDLNNISYPDAGRNVLEFTRTSKNITNLTINGQIINTADKIVLKQSNDKAVTALVKSGVQAALSDAKKFAVMPKASTDSFDVSAEVSMSSGKATYSSYEQNAAFRTVKASKGVYLTDATLNSDLTLLTRTTDAGEEGAKVYETACLDYAQAVNEINTIADVNSDYVIMLHAFNAASTEEVDTVVTDKYAYGTFTLPGSNKKNELVIGHADEDRKATVPFTGNISGYGSIIVQNVELSPVKSSSSSAAVDAKITVSADKTTDSPVLTLQNVSTKIAVADTTSSKGFISSIAGTKNKTDVVFVDCGNLILKTGISNVDEVLLTDTKLFTAGASTINTLRIADSAGTQKISSWDSLGKLTVNDVYMPTGVTTSYIGTKQDANGNPQFVLNNEVEQGKLLCKVYIKDTVITDADEIFAVALDTRFAKEPAKYSGVSLVSAKKASADRIRAYVFRDAVADGSSIVDNAEEMTTDNLISYKVGAYVVNGNKANMAVQITEHAGSEDGEVISSFYAESIDAAVTAINNKADTNSYYVIQFIQKGTQEAPRVIRTTKNGTTYGAFTLPSKAAGVTVRGYEAVTGEDEGEVINPGTVIKYTGALKASCDVKFENILLTEGSVIKKPVDENDFTEKGSITLTPSTNVVMTFGEKVFTVADETKKEQVVDGNLCFASVSGSKGAVVLNGNRVVSAGSITVRDLTLADGASLNTTGKVSVTNLFSDGSDANKLASSAAMSIGTVGKVESENGMANVILQTGFTKPKKKTDRPMTQLTVSGDIKDANVIIVPQLYRTDGASTDMTEAELLSLRMDSRKNPEGYRKLANVTKASLDNITVLGTGMESGFAAYDDAYEGAEAQTYLYKYAAGLYLTNAEPLVKVTGYAAPEENAEAYMNADMCYQAEFSTWDQAVKEIDKINNKTRFYEIELLDTIGTIVNNGAGESVTSPLGTVSMPAKAAEVRIASEDGEKNGIFFTGTTLTVKCPTVMENIGFTCVKKYGKGTAAYYDEVAFTMNTGNFKLTQINMVDDFGGMKTTPYNISGSAKGVFEVLADTQGGRAFASVKNIKELIVKYTNAPDEGGGYGDFIMECSGDLSVKNLTVANSKVEARNITVSTSATLNEASLQAGTSAANDGKLTIKDIKLADNGNILTAEQNKSGASQITINGTVTLAEKATEDAFEEGAIALKLNYSIYQKKFLWWVLGDSISQKPAQLYDGMILCVAPKAADAELFIPVYTVKADNGNGAVDGMGVFHSGYGTYKSGKNICYGKF